MYLKQKRCGRIKARGCADGRKQRLYKNKHETSSPTVRTESVFLSCVVDAIERQHVICADIPGAFMQANIDEIVHVKFEGEIAELLVMVDPSLYKQYLCYEQGKPVIYVQLQKALYGTLQAALLFWKELSDFIVNELGFTLNVSTNCVANKIINGKQCTILWHVDDLKISHVDKAVLDEVLAKLNERYGKEQPLTVSDGKIHDYLGMQLDYTTIGSVAITMYDFVEGLLDEVPDDMKSCTYASPATGNLFNVRLDVPALGKKASEEFHTMVAKLLYLSKRARPDIATAVAYLTTRVTKPNQADYAKLRRCIGYLRQTKDLALTLSGDDLHNVQWYVDASFAVHPDMRSHTGIIMTFGKGAVISMLVRQKLNTKSSTEAELVGVDDAMSQIVWNRNFLRAQGIDVKDNVIYQDNQSAILLENNRRASSGKRTRHIDIHYFFIKNRIARKEMRVEYCPTEQMLANILTKPLGGSQFRYLRNQLLNIPSSRSIIPDSQECVETSGQTQESSASSSTYAHDYVISDTSQMAETESAEDWIVVKNRKRQHEKGVAGNSTHTVSRI